MLVLVLLVPIPVLEQHMASNLSKTPQVDDASSKLHAMSMHSNSCMEVRVYGRVQPLNPKPFKP